jgi:hypothetical protein
MFASKPLCAADPFDLLLTPDAVLQAVERSAHLGQLHRRVCRPLDAREADAARKAEEREREHQARRAAGFRYA